VRQQSSRLLLAGPHGVLGNGVDNVGPSFTRQIAAHAIDDDELGARDRQSDILPVREQQHGVVSAMDDHHGWHTQAAQGRAPAAGSLDS
jgi:hypothetical protein